MKQVILNIPEKNYDFFMELIENLGFVEPSTIEIPEEHKNIVRKRIEDSNLNPERLLDWDEVKNDLKSTNAF